MRQQQRLENRDLEDELKYQKTTECSLAFPKDDKYGFWMKDMLVPVDIFWLDNKGQVVSIARDVATSTYPNVFYPTEPARFVLETTAGFAREHNIATGTPLRLKNLERVSQ